MEDDLYGDLYFGDARPAPLKAFDQTGDVILCSSFSKTVAPGFRVGWLAAGRHAERIRKLKLATSIHTNTLAQLDAGRVPERGRGGAPPASAAAGVSRPGGGLFGGGGSPVPGGDAGVAPAGGAPALDRAGPRQGHDGIVPPRARAPGRDRSGTGLFDGRHLRSLLPAELRIPAPGGLEEALETLATLAREL